MKKQNFTTFLFILLIILVAIDITIRLQQILNKPTQNVTINRQPITRARIGNKKFENLYRAGKTIVSATDVGVSFTKLNELMQSFATEISIVKDKNLTEAEQGIMMLYEDALKCYGDSIVLWKAMIERNVDDLRHTTGEDENYLRSLKPMLNKYNIEVEERMGMYRIQPVLPEDSLQRIWSVASEKIKTANDILYK